MDNEDICMPIINGILKDERFQSLTIEKTPKEG